MFDQFKKVAISLIFVFFITPNVFAEFGNFETCFTYGTKNRKVKNIIVMVPDGCSQSIQTLARWVKGSDLHVDALSSGMVKTYMANSVITGSAAAGTAFATGHKTTARFLGIGPSDDKYAFLSTYTPTAAPYVPLASVLEGAKMQGRATGLIATSRITHATPAAYACHIQDRGWDNEIMEHIVYENVDVVFGGGARHLIPTGDVYTTSFGDTWKGKRTDGENLMQVLADRGYVFVDNKDDMMAHNRGPIWGMFDDSHMDPELDRDDLHPTQPSIAEMTEKAIDILSQDKDGFFLMVEGSQVDWAGHSNDAAYMVNDFIAFDEAVGKAIKFAKRNKNTLVLIFPDHNTGALSIGHQQADQPSYTNTTVEDLIDPVKDATMTIQGLLYEVPMPANTTGVIATFADRLGSYWADNMTEEHAQFVADQLNEKGPYYAYYPISEYLSKELTTYGWTTHGHSGEDVPLWSYGINRPIGLFDNTDIAKIVAKGFGFKLAKMTKRLFVDASQAFPNSYIDKTDEENPILVVGDAKLPTSKDYIEFADGTVKTLPGIVVYAPAIDKVFIPKKAVRMLRQT